MPAAPRFAVRPTEPTPQADTSNTVLFHPITTIGSDTLSRANLDNTLANFATAIDTELAALHAEINALKAALRAYEILAEGA